MPKTPLHDCDWHEYHSRVAALAFRFEEPRQADPTAPRPDNVGALRRMHQRAVFMFKVQDALELLYDPSQQTEG